MVECTVTWRSKYVADGMEMLNLREAKSRFPVQRITARQAKRSSISSSVNDAVLISWTSSAYKSPAIGGDVWIKGFSPLDLEKNL